MNNTNTNKTEQKQKTEILPDGRIGEWWYHSFTDGMDEWHTTVEQAKQWIKERRNEGYRNFRIYTELCEKHGDMMEESLLWAEGNFPD